jgi:hypothetical protein
MRQSQFLIVWHLISANNIFESRKWLGYEIQEPFSIYPVSVSAGSYVSHKKNFENGTAENGIEEVGRWID